MPQALELDHLVVAAASLAEGVAWCEATLGITPGPGGEHALFGTHNRLFKVASASFPRAYFEIIAINPKAVPTRSGKRWFDLDDEALQARLKQNGPQLIHWVARTGDVTAATANWREQGVERGEVLQASRPTPNGVLEWHITVRPDGQRLMQGCLPTLIQWGATHPVDSMPDSGVTLQAFTLHAPAPPQAGAMPHTCRKQISCASQALFVLEGAWNMAASLSTPKGEVLLRSPAQP